MSISVSRSAPESQIRLSGTLPTAATGWTVYGWVKRTSAAGSGYESICWGNCSDVSNVPGYYYFLGRNAGTGVSYIESNSLFGVTDPFNGGAGDSYPAVGEWVFWAISIDSWGGTPPGPLAYAYLWNADGTLIERLDGLSGSISPTFIEVATQPDFDGSMNALVGRTGVVGRAMSQAELEAEMISPTPVLTADLWSHFDGSDAACPDTSGNGRNWTTLDTAYNADEPPYVYPSTADTSVLVVFVVTPSGTDRRWVDYIPVKEVTPGRNNSYDNDGALAVSEITDTTGKVAWVDYIPVTEDAGTAAGKWRYDNNGWIPDQSQKSRTRRRFHS